MDTKDLISDTVNVYFTTLARLINSARHDYLVNTKYWVNKCKKNALEQAKAYFLEQYNLSITEFTSTELWQIIIDRYIS